MSAMHAGHLSRRMLGNGVPQKGQVSGQMKAGAAGAVAGAVAV